MSKKACIVGAGVGGLALAARLASRGHKVEVFEKLSECGGRAHIIEDKGFKFDTGPSFVLMPGFFEEVFSYCGEDIKDYLNLKALDVNYRIFYPGGETLTVYKDSERTKQELEKLEAGAARAFDGFIKETAEIYKAVEPLLYRCFGLKDLINPKYLLLINKIRAGQTYWQLAKKFFKTDKLRYAFTFEAMFIGVSPFEAPAFYSVITYADHVQKIYHPLGGMYEIPKALERIARKFGAEFRYDTEVKKIRHFKNDLVLESPRGSFNAGRVFVNADYPYAQTDLLERKIPNYKYSCSTYLIYLGLKQKIKGLEHHNLFFSSDLKKNLRDIFDTKVMPSDPSFYAHVPTVTDPFLAPEGKDIVYILIPVSNLNKNRDNFSEYQDWLRRTAFERLNQALGINIEDLIEVERRFYPQDFTSRYNIKYGATFGLSHTFFQSAFFRPSNVDRIKNLYFLGASTQPGGGLPTVIASSRIAADLVRKAKR